MKYTLLRTDGTEEILNPIAENGLSEYQKEEPGSLSLAYMYQKINCSTVELVVLNDKMEIWCDEEGLLQDTWEINKKATELYRENRPGYELASLIIVGNAILVEHE